MPQQIPFVPDKVLMFCTYWYILTLILKLPMLEPRDGKVRISTMVQHQGSRHNVSALQMRQGKVWISAMLLQHGGRSGVDGDDGPEGSISQCGKTDLQQHKSHHRNVGKCG
jgi:hypothetical protein